MLKYFNYNKKSQIPRFSYNKKHVILKKMSNYCQSFLLANRLPFLSRKKNCISL